MKMGGMEECFFCYSSIIISTVKGMCKGEEEQEREKKGEIIYKSVWAMELREEVLEKIY